jgi:hypothetical protein
MSATARLEEVVRRIAEQHFPLLATRKDDKLNHSPVQVPTKGGLEIQVQPWFVMNIVRAYTNY